MLASDKLSATFYGLSAETDYTFHLWWRPSAQSPWTRILPPASCTTAEPPLPAPIGAACTAAVDSLTLRWNPVAGATRYRVSRDAEKNWKETTRTSFTLTGLAADSLYDAIHLQTGDADSWDRIIAVSCKTLPATALAAPGGLRCTATDSTITLRWNPVAGATRYRTGHGHTWTPASGAARQHTLGGLQAGTAYDLRVQAGDADGWQSAAAAKPCSTEPGPLQAPVLRCTAATRSSVTWGWEPVPGATGYEHTTTSAWQTTNTPDLANPSITIASGPSSSHRLHVRATHGDTAGPETVHECNAAPGDGRPTHPEAPLPVCAAATTTTITVQWPPAFAATSYKTSHSNNNHRIQNHTKTELAATITGLKPNQSSTMIVRAANTTGTALGVATCRTLAQPPQNPTITCTANQKGPPTITIAWDATTGADNYQATLTRQERPLGGPPQTALIAQYTGTRTNTTADGDHNTQYQTQTRARTTAGWTDWTTPATTRCPTPKP